MAAKSGAGSNSGSRTRVGSSSPRRPWRRRPSPRHLDEHGEDPPRAVVRQARRLHTHRGRHRGGEDGTPADLAAGDASSGLTNSQSRRPTPRHHSLLDHRQRGASMQSNGSNGSAEEQPLTRVPRRSTQSLLTAIGLTIVATLAVFAIERVFWYPVGRWSLFYPVVLACAWFGGRASGIVATLLSTALMWWFLVLPENERLGDGAGDDLVVALVFVATGILISIASHASRRNAAGLARHYHHLQTILDFSPD